MKKAVARLEAERREARLYLNLTDPGLASGSAALATGRDTHHGFQKRCQRCVPANALSIRGDLRSGDTD